jgi:glycosyltransferase involved in cell wall biosynthesis
MKVLFVSSGNSEHFEVAPFVKSQGESLKREGLIVEFYQIKGKGLYGYFKNISALREKIRIFDPDVIHAHYSLTGWVALMANSKKSRILSLMGSDAYGTVGRAEKRTLFNIFMLFQVFLIQFFYKNIIVKSDNLRKSVWRKKNVSVIPNGVNFDRFKPLDKIECREKLGLPLDKKIILFMGNPKEGRKNFALVEKAIEKISDENLMVCTPFPVTHENVPVYLNASDVLAFPSFQEGSPNVVKEAMACNCPIVASDAGDIVEVISGTDGCFITSFKVEDMVSKLEMALQFNGKTNGRQNIKHMNEHFIANKLINIYGKICK